MLPGERSHSVRIQQPTIFRNDYGVPRAVAVVPHVRMPASLNMPAVKCYSFPSTRVNEIIQQWRAGSG